MISTTASLQFFNQTRTALITGAARGIGSEIAKALNLAGVDVISPTREQLDLADPKSIAAYTQSLKNDRVHVDILVNNAGINELRLISEIDDSTLQKMFQVNLFAAMNLVRAFAPKMQEKKWGRIINIGSIFGTLTKERRALYSMTKSALDSLTRTTTVEFSRHGILCNTLSPGYVETELTYKNNSASDIEKILQNIPCAKMAKPAQIAAYVVFLASDLNTYLTGQNITVDGGFTCQ